MEPHLGQLRISTGRLCAPDGCSCEIRSCDAGAGEEAEELTDDDGRLDEAGVGFCEGVEGAVDLGNGLGCEEEEAERKGGQ